MDKTLKIENIGYHYPNLIFSLNKQTWLIRVKDGRGKKWLKIGVIDNISIFPTIKNDLSHPLPTPIRNLTKFIRSILDNFPTRLNNTNEYARNFIWAWRHGIYEDKSGVLVSER